MLLVLCAALGTVLMSSLSATAASKLDAPEVTLGAVTTTTVALSWEAVPGATGYIVRRETRTYAVVSDKNGKGNLLAKAAADLTVPPIAETTYTDSSFPASNSTQTTYLSYKVRAVAGDGTQSRTSNQIEVRVPRDGVATPLTAPGDPSTCTVTTAPVTFTVTFTPATGGLEPIHYIVRRTGGGEPKEFTIDPTVNNPISFTDSDVGLKANQTFKYKVKAVDAIGTVSAVTKNTDCKARTA
jgi:hypothetical protein